MGIALDLAGWCAIIHACQDDAAVIVARFQEKYGGAPFTVPPDGAERRHVFVALGDIPPPEFSVSGLPDVVQRAWLKFHNLWSFVYEVRGTARLEEFPHRPFGFSWTSPDDATLQLHGLIVSKKFISAYGL